LDKTCPSIEEVMLWIKQYNLLPRPSFCHV
jgi:hypothetical protein